MDDIYVNRMNMINTTVYFCDQNTGPTATITAFNTALNGVKGKVVLINGLNMIANGTTKGVTTDVKVLRKVMSEIAVKCGRGCVAYATITNNNTLKALVDFTEWDLKQKRKEEVDDICQQIHDACNSNIGALDPDYNVTAQDLIDLQTAIDLYRMASQKPRYAIIDKSEARRKERLHIDDVVKTYFKGVMDNIVDTLKPSNFDYWKGYDKARIVVDLGHTTAKLRGSVLDAENTPIRKAIIKIFETGTTNLVAQGMTDNKGQYVLSNLHSGNYDFRWEKVGYITQTEEDVHISPGKELRRKIVLVKVPNNRVFEGDVFAPGFMSITMTGFVPTDLTMVELELSAGMRIYGATAANTPPGPGQPFWDAAAGNSSNSAEDFATLTGADGKPFVTFQNNGVGSAHFKITFTNVE
jgi:hypothetical protein